MPSLFSELKLIAVERKSLGAKILERYPVDSIKRKDGWLVSAANRLFHSQVLVNVARAWGDRICHGW